MPPHLRRPAWLRPVGAAFRVPGHDRRLYARAVEYSRRPDGSITEIPPTLLDCGHPNGPRLSTVGYDWSAAHQRRTRTFCCRACGRVTYQG